MPGALDIRPRSRPDPRIPYLRIDVMRRAGPSVNQTRRLSSLVGYPRSAQASDRVRRGFSRNTVSDMDELNLLKYRQAMVKIIAVHASMCLDEIGKDRLSDPVMQAMATVPRHRFVPVELQEVAYEDLPLPIGCGKTTSQPFIVALMTDLLAIEEQDKILEIGTGLGYQAAILTELARRVFSVEIIEELAREAELRLRATGCNN